MTSRRHGQTSSLALLLAALLAAMLLFGATACGGDSSGSEPTVTQEAPQVQDPADLKEAEEFVNNTDIDGVLDTGEIDETLNE